MFSFNDSHTDLVNAFRNHYMRYEHLVNEHCVPGSSEFVLSRLKDDLDQFITLANEYSPIFEHDESLHIRTNLQLMCEHVAQQHREALEQSHQGRPQLVHMVHTGQRGRPSYQIDRNFLEWAYSLRSTSAIARFLGVGRTVVRNALLEYGIVMPQQNPFQTSESSIHTSPPDASAMDQSGSPPSFPDDILDPSPPSELDVPADIPRPQSYTGPLTNISDSEIESLIFKLRGHFPRAGITMMDGLLRRLGLHIPRERIRTTLHSIDPVHRVFERVTIRRRNYSVPGPNSLWHHDGQHGLIRWKIVTHGFIDGYSRLITGLRASNNNRPSTVLDVFLCSIDQHGVPSRIRGDHGIENVLVAAWMDTHRGVGRGSYIWGRSVHNVRIERLWVDFTVQIGDKWYTTFVSLELHHGLDINSTNHIWLLHHLFLGIINQELQIFAEAWNHHKIQMQHGPNRSPIDMFGFDMYVHGVRGDFNTLEEDSEPLSMEEQEVFGVDWQAFQNDHLMSSRAANNDPSEDSTSFLGQTGPPEQLSGVELDPPVGPMTAAEQVQFNELFSQWIGQNPGATALDMWDYGLALARTSLPGQF